MTLYQQWQNSRIHNESWYSACVIIAIILDTVGVLKKRQQEKSLYSFYEAISQQFKNYVAELLFLFWLREEDKQRVMRPKQTCARDDNVHLSDDFIQLHQPKPIHAAIGRKTITSIRLMQWLRQQQGIKHWMSRVLPGLQGTDGVNLCDVDNGAHCFQGSTASFSNLRKTRWDIKTHLGN